MFALLAQCRGPPSFNRRRRINRRYFPSQALFLSLLSSSSTSQTHLTSCLTDPAQSVRIPISLSNPRFKSYRLTNIKDHQSCAPSTHPSLPSSSQPRLSHPRTATTKTENDATIKTSASVLPRTTPPVRRNASVTPAFQVTIAWLRTNNGVALPVALSPTGLAARNAPIQPE